MSVRSRWALALPPRRVREASSVRHTSLSRSATRRKRGPVSNARRSVCARRADTLAYPRAHPSRGRIRRSRRPSEESKSERRGIDARASDSVAPRLRLRGGNQLRSAGWCTLRRLKVAHYSVPLDKRTRIASIKSTFQVVTNLVAHGAEKRWKSAVPSRSQKPLEVQVSRGFNSLPLRFTHAGFDDSPPCAEPETIGLCNRPGQSTQVHQDPRYG
jgi:hypothetical protein